jgi:hypothetical protein
LTTVEYPRSLEDYFSGNKGWVKEVKAPRHSAPSKRKNKFDERRIVAWDGEGANIPWDGRGGFVGADGVQRRHIYNLLANSSGNHILNPHGLSTEKCLEFFLAENDPRSINVIFAGSYDVNMLLRDLSRADCKTLWDTGHVRWRDYNISYTPRRSFSVGKIHYGAKGWTDEPRFVLWDVFGFFQSSFVRAVEKWLGDLDGLDAIQQMKLQRSVFTSDRIEEIITYCLSECKLLVALVDKLFDALEEADIRISRYDGAGSIAGALLRKYSVKEHVGEIPPLVYEMSQFAYSGGHIEAPMVGNYEGLVTQADVVSAYPAACLELPSYAGASWTVDDEWSGSHSSLVEVEWHIEKDLPFYPLFYRTQQGRILYPKEGHGVYYGSEIQLLRDFFHEGVDYQIIRAINPQIVSNAKPFRWLADVFAIRARYKAEGNMAQEALKLGINSVYGKLAQQKGWSLDRGAPSHHHLLWAGEITSRTRAKLFRLAFKDPERVIAFATDAVFFKGVCPPCRRGKLLGDWEVEKYDGMTIVQPGVYWLKQEDEWKSKYRGFDAGSLARQSVLDRWESGEDYKATLTRFVTLGSALARRSDDFYTYWRTWPTEDRTLSLSPANKREAIAGRSRYWKQLERTRAVDNPEIGEMSKPFAIAWLQTKADELEYIIDREMEDSYA